MPVRRPALYEGQAIPRDSRPGYRTYLLQLMFVQPGGLSVYLLFSYSEDITIQSSVVTEHLAGISLCIKYGVCVTKKHISGTLSFRRLQCKARTGMRDGFISFKMIVASVSAVFPATFLLSYLYLPHISCRLRTEACLAQVFNIKGGF